MIIKNDKTHEEGAIFVFVGTLICFAFVGYYLGWKISLILFGWWFALVISEICQQVGRTLIMDSTGCTIKFFFIEKKVNWDEFKTKKIVGEELRGNDPERIRYVLFSKKKNVDCSSGLKRGFIFSDVFVTFRWKNPKKIYHRGSGTKQLVEEYCVDEETFMAKMHEWNVKIDVEMDTKIINAYAVEPMLTPVLLEAEKKASEAMKNYVLQDNQKLRSVIQGYNKCRVYKIQEMLKYTHETGVVIYSDDISVAVRSVHEKNRRGEVVKTFYIEDKKYERLEEIGDVLDNYCDAEGFLTVGVVDSSLLDCHVRRQNQL